MKLDESVSKEKKNPIIIYIHRDQRHSLIDLSKEEKSTHQHLIKFDLT